MELFLILYVIVAVPVLLFFLSACRLSGKISQNEERGIYEQKE